jgi:hypothetical protein
MRNRAVFLEASQKSGDNRRKQNIVAINVTADFYLVKIVMTMSFPWFVNLANPA